MYSIWVYVGLAETLIDFYVGTAWKINFFLAFHNLHLLIINLPSRLPFREVLNYSSGVRDDYRGHF